MAKQNSELVEIIENTERCLRELKCIARKALQQGKIEKTLAAVNAAANLLYQYNQKYTDKELEDFLLQVGEIEPFLQELPQKIKMTHKKRVIFYDRFGLDIRGWALCYVKAFTRLNYDVYYVTTLQAKGHEPEIDAAIKNGNGKVKKVYVDFQQGYLSACRRLTDIFTEFAPKSAFFYTTPDDVVGTTVFNRLKGKVTRYQVDLTDHAYWLGVNAADYCVASRSIGAGIEVYQRGFKKEQILVLDGCAVVHDDIPFDGFDFDTDGKRVVFSGGALYKTLGDKENTYYRMVEHILKKHSDIIFYYLGNGDQTELIRLKEKFPAQVYFDHERRDFFEIMKRCAFYLNTYPMFGGLMMRYAAMAQKLPITLKHEHDADGILFNQDTLGIEYDNATDLLDDVDRLLDNPDYLRQREAKMKGATILEDDFRRNLESLIDSQFTEYHVPIEPVDTEKFRKEYLERFNFQEQKQKSIATKMNRSLLTEYPMLFMQRFINKFI